MRTAIVLLSLPLLAACESESNATSAIGIANPASVYCAELGGTTVIREGDDGQVGYCRLPNGAEVDEWELYRQDHPTGEE